jgi:hypothetical protein
MKIRHIKNCAGFEVVVAVTMKNTTFWDAMPKFPDVLKELTASISRVKE